ncbi:MAG: MFS transporter [Verrucomicrobia bacterium]|nr:MFS transporter [Verrucomicrobiota bacterium]|tara:strand:- start:33023 stop:34618 length:1596 start_codon:yes stop_codon:yes gene_type:complete
MSKSDVIAPNASRLFWAGFIAILAAGVGFAIRGGIFDNWAKEYGFTGAQLGAIGGAGFSGFCFGIILGGIVVDKIGYGKLVLVALLCHIISYFVTFGASTPENAYSFLFWGMFLFAFANGTLEAVANPLVATLYPKQRTHYLNMLHAAWPAGMILGVAAGWLLDDKMEIGWKTQLSLYLIPTVAYGVMFMGQKYPKSEAAEKGASFVQMFKSVGILGALVACYLLALFFGDLFKGIAPETSNMIGYGIGGALLIVVALMTKFSWGSIILFILFIAHAMIGAVELGTDGWIQNITGNLFTSEQGKYLFLWTSAIMFALRFSAHWLETKLKLSPIGLLLVCSLIAFAGLSMAANMQSFAMAMVALGIYAVGKTFFWPTMLAVVGDRYPHTGAVAMSIMGGIGMLSAGLIGGPGLGYSKDRFAGEELKKADSALYEEYKAETPSAFLNIPATKAFGLDGTKLAEAKEAEDRTEAQETVVAADQKGDRLTLEADSYIPLVMAGIYLILFIYFKSIGGYKPLSIEEMAGGVEGPVR